MPMDNGDGGRSVHSCFNATSERGLKVACPPRPPLPPFGNTNQTVGMNCPHEQLETGRSLACTVVSWAPPSASTLDVLIISMHAGS